MERVCIWDIEQKRKVCACERLCVWVCVYEEEWDRLDAYKFLLEGERVRAMVSLCVWEMCI